MDEQTVVESVETLNAETEDSAVEVMPVAKCASPVKTPSESVSDSDDDFEDARDASFQVSKAAALSSQAADEEASNGTGDEDEGDLSEEDMIVDFLGKSTGEAEARLAVRRQARAEAREIRMRELERQQKEAEENADRIYDMHPENVLRTPPVRTGSSASGRTPVVNSTGGNYQWSRRSSEDSLEDGVAERGVAERGGSNLRDVRHELKEVDDKFRKAMIQNAQLDNEKASFTYQVELLKDRLEDLEVAHSQLQKEHKEKCRKADQLKRLAARLKEDLDMCQAALEERDRLIQEQGLVIVGDEGEMDGCESAQDAASPRKALVSIESAEMLQRAGEGSLDVRLRKFAEERNELMDQIRHLKLELEEERNRHRNGPRTASINGGSDTDMEDVQREANKLLGDYKFKLQKAEQDVSTLQANVARLESQVIRYRSAAETAEKVEDELKSERRRLQREEGGFSDAGTQTSVTEDIYRVCETGEKTDETNCDFWATTSEDARQKPSSPVQQDKDDGLDFWASISTETDIIPKRKSITTDNDGEPDNIEDQNGNIYGQVDVPNGQIQEINSEVEDINDEIEDINVQIGESNDEIEDINVQIGEANDEIEDIRGQIDDINDQIEAINEVRVNGDEDTSGRIEDRSDSNDQIEDSEDRSESNDLIENEEELSGQVDDSESNGLIENGEDRSDQIENGEDPSGQIDDEDRSDSNSQIEDGNDHSRIEDVRSVRSESSDRIEDDRRDMNGRIEDASDQIEETKSDRSEGNDQIEEDKSSEGDFWSGREKSSEENEVRVNGRKVSFSVKDDGETKACSEQRRKSDSLSFYEETFDKLEAEDDESSDRCSYNTDSDVKSDVENGDTFEDIERIHVADVNERSGLQRNDSVDFWNVIKDSKERCPVEINVGFTLTKPKSFSQDPDSETVGHFVSDSRVDRS